MSYKQVGVGAGVGAYYPIQLGSYYPINGLGGCSCGFGAYGASCGCAGLGAFGAVEFSAATVRDDFLKSVKDNAAGVRWAGALRAALAQLGYGGEVSSFDASWLKIPSDRDAWLKFAGQWGFPTPAAAPIGLPPGTRDAAFTKIEALVKETNTGKEPPGPDAPIVYEKTPGGGYVPTEPPAQQKEKAQAEKKRRAKQQKTAQAGISGVAIGVGVAALAALIGIGVLVSKKKKTAPGPQTV